MTQVDPVDAEVLARRLVPDKAALLVAGVRSLNGVYRDNGCGWIGHVNWLFVGKSIGMAFKRIKAVAYKLEDMGLNEARNDYDGWLTVLGLQVACILDPALPSGPITKLDHSLFNYTVSERGPH